MPDPADLPDEQRIGYELGEADGRTLAAIDAATTLIDRIIRGTDEGLYQGMAAKAAEALAKMIDRNEPEWKQLVVQAVFRRLKYEIDEGEDGGDADDPTVVKAG